MITENGHGTGGIPSSKDNRDYKYSNNIGGASIPFDWQKGFDIESIVGKLPVKDQEASFSCGGQAWASLSYALNHSSKEEKSAKYIYCQTHVGTGGSSGRDNSNICKNQGVSTEVLCPSHPATESFMTTNDRTPQAIANAKTNKENWYASVNHNIEDVAQAIRDNGGVVLGVYGKNNGTWLSKFPQPPIGTYQDLWAHWLYAGKAVTINGKKYIGFLNSWGTDVGENGWQYIGEEYFNAQWGMFEIWTMTYDSQVVPPVNMPTLKLGSKGDAVKTLQTLLKAQNSPVGVIDGIFGVMTQRAVINFQLSHSLVGDGIVGNKTWQALNK